MSFEALLTSAIQQSFEQLLKENNLSLVSNSKQQVTQILNCKQAANYVGVSPDTIRKWINTGLEIPFANGERKLIRLRSIPLEGKLLIDEQDLLEFLETIKTND